MIEQNHEYHISFGVAKLLKEAGFNWECRGYFDGIEFHPNGSVECTNYNSNTCKYLKAPTLDVAQRWLREVKHFEIYALRDTFDCKFYYIGEEPDSEWGNRHFIKCDVDTDTYEEALEAGIKKALEIILEKGE